MERKNKKGLQKSQSLLDRPVPKLAYNKKSKVIKALPPPLIPTAYVAPTPKPKPRTQNSRRPVSLPRYIPKKVSEKVKNARELSEKKNFKVVVTEKDRALKNYAKSFEVSIVAKEDIAQQLFNTRSDVFQLLERELSQDRGIKVEVTLRVLMKKKDENGELIFAKPYFNCLIFTITNKYEIEIALDKADEEIKRRAA